MKGATIDYLSFSIDRKIILQTIKRVDERLHRSVYLKLLLDIEKEFNNIQYGDEKPTEYFVPKLYLPSLHRYFGLGGIIDNWRRRKLARSLDNEILKLKNPKISNLNICIRQLKLSNIQISYLIMEINKTGIPYKIDELDYIINRVSDAISGFRKYKTLNDTWLLYGAFHWYKLSEWVKTNEDILCNKYREK